VLTAFAERYQRPVFLTETSFTGSVEERLRWLDDSVACLHRLRASGVDVVGYTWWSLLDMVRWDYREGLLPPEAYMIRMGLCDLQPDGAGVLTRVPNKVLDRFREHAAAAVPADGQPDSGTLTGVPGDPG
jgi:beta-glucosidase/6-phospho-beta-glucosidase/beta-galactosidase